MQTVQWVKRHPAETAWLGLGGFVFTYDMWALLSGHETMSAAFARTRKDVQEGLTPRKKFLKKSMIITAAPLVTSAHLIWGDKIKWVDPFHIIALLAKGIEFTFKR